MRKPISRIRRIVLAGLSLAVLALYAPRAKATPTDFICKIGCGTVQQIGNQFFFNYGSANIVMSVNGGNFTLPLGDGDEGPNHSLCYSTPMAD